MDDNTPADRGETYAEMMAQRCWVTKSAEDFASEAEDRFEAHYESYQTSGIGETVSRSYRMYHSMDPEGHSEGYNTPSHSPGFIGEQGEFVYTEINHYRNHINHQLAIVMSDRPEFVVHATSNDSDAIEQVPNAEAVIDHAMGTRGVGETLFLGAETALVESIGWVRLDWDHFSKELVSHALGVFDVAYQRCRRIEDAEWLVARVPESKWRLVAEAQRSGDEDLAFEIADHKSDEDEKRAWPQNTASGGSTDDEDVVFVMHVYCKPTPQRPNGRYMRALPGGVILEDGDFPFAEIPVYPIAPSYFVRSTVPYSTSWDLMSTQTLQNATLSAMATRIDAFGVPNIAYQEGTEIGVHENGLALWPMPPGAAPPQVLEFLGAFPQALPQFHQLMEALGVKLSGVNEVARGQAADNVKSGSHAALLEAAAIKFNNALERAVTYAMERIATGIIRMYQAFATDELVLAITGEDDHAVIRRFQASGLEHIARVAVRRTNPVMKTNAGKQEAALNLLQQGTMKHPTEYLSVIKTGNLNPVYADDLTLVAHIKDENSRLLNGERVQAADLENHPVHLLEHMARFDARLRDNNPQAAQALAEHIMDHIQRYNNLSMANSPILQVQGIPPLQPSPQVQAMMAQVGAAPPQQPEQPGQKPGPAPKPQNSAGRPDGPARMPKPAEPATVKGDPK